MDWNEVVRALAAALGIGLLIGAVRERAHDQATGIAGVRTHALLALLGAISYGFGMAAYVAVLLSVALLSYSAHVRTRDEDPGLTGEVAMLLTVVLAGLARESASLAAGLGVVAAALLWAKDPLRRLSRELISDREVKDGLLLAAAALVVLPLLPDAPLDPWGVLQPSMLWRIVVLVMAVGMLGHLALRAVGARRGLPVAGFFSGFASSTAAVASYGRLARDTPRLAPEAAAAALLSNLASVLLLAAVTGAVSPAFLRAAAWPLAGASIGLLLVAATGLKHTRGETPEAQAPQARAFHLTHAIGIAVLIAAVMLAAEALRRTFGDAGALIGATVAALAELQAAGATIARLAEIGGLSQSQGRWGVVGLLAASALAKLILAFASGGARYGRVTGSGLALMVGLAALGAAFAPD